MTGQPKAATRISWDHSFFILIIAVMNVHLLGIGRLDSLIFLPSAVASGEFWRLVTHPFAHVSWYHLMLDASAFMVLYGMLRQGALGRFAHVVVCGAISLGTACLLSPDIQSLGLCGLSGIAHGLMTVVSMDMIRDKQDRLLGILSLCAVILKSLVEMMTGQVLFASLHHGLCGIPVAACHGGGVLGGMVSWGLLWGTRMILKERGREALSMET